MADVPLSISAGERELLSQLLTAALGDTRVEVRRTEFSATLKEQLRDEEETIRGLLKKLEALGDKPE